MFDKHTNKIDLFITSSYLPKPILRSGRSFIYSAREKVKNITKFARFCPVNLSVLTKRAGNGGKLFVLHIENFCEETARRRKLPCLEITIATFRAYPILFLHIPLLSEKVGYCFRIK